MTEIEPPMSIKMTHAGDQVINNADQVTDQVPTGARCADDPVKELIAVLGDREMSASELMRGWG
ncbi:hypothetical protein HF885_00340 [Olsenella umbonata]|uniref:Uncharacterized protein n=1 Tax=Parafannyhessea umbonata TaxID=604330 RepID=A0A7X9T934_9ACTN|nr:hypothetical protein [Parafannyhessea umbonata]